MLYRRAALSRTLLASMGSPSLVLAALTVASVTAALAAGCGPAGPKAPPRPSATAMTGPAIDPCADDKTPPPHPFDGPLKSARCEQEMFSTMAGIAEDLGVKCGYCHVPKPNNPKSFEYERMTEHKEVALWMSHTFMSGLARADGKPMTCGEICHVDRNGKPAAKFLGEPRDVSYAANWMTTVMVNQLRKRDGSKLKCKDCHGAAWGMPGFQAKVIGKTEQVPHGPEGAAPVASPPGSSPTAPAPATTPAPPTTPAPTP